MVGQGKTFLKEHILLNNEMYATMTKHKNIVVETFHINIVLLLILNHSYKKSVLLMAGLP